MQDNAVHSGGLKKILTGGCDPSRTFSNQEREVEEPKEREVEEPKMAKITFKIQPKREGVATPVSPPPLLDPPLVHRGDWIEENKAKSTEFCSVLHLFVVFYLCILLQH